MSRWLAAGVLLGLTVAQAAPAQTWRTINAARQQQGSEQALHVNVEYGAGALRLRSAEQPFLYQFEARYDADQFKPVTNYDPASGRLNVGIEGRSKLRNVQDGGRLALALAPDVPLALDLQFGAGEADLDLGDLSLQSVDVSTGASETRIRFDRPNRRPAEHVRLESGAASLRATGLGNARAARYSFEGGVGETVLDFGGEWTQSATASVQMGIGSLSLRFPRTLGVRITKTSFLTSFDAPGFAKRGKAYYSSNWDSAPHRLSIDIDAALGSIDVNWTDR